MKVNKKKAAQMVGIGRTTFYRHLEEKQISVDSDGRIDVSELIRVYGNDAVKTPEQLKQSRSKTVEQVGTQSVQMEEEIKRLKSEIENLNSERRREREQLTDQIETLKSNLEKSMSQNSNLTTLLTDERSQTEKLADQKKSEQEEKLEAVLATVKKINDQQNEGSSWWPFGKKRKIAG